MPSTSFGTKKRPAGKKYRDGTLGKALSDLYHDVEAAFVSLEAVVATKAPDVSSLVLGTETLTATGAISATLPLTYMNNTAADAAMTLAVGTLGQTKQVVKKSASTHTATIASTNLIPATPLVLKAPGDSVVLSCDGTKWYVVGTPVITA